VLPEIETVLPDRGARAKPAKTERADEGARYILQVGSFASFPDADQLKAKLALQGMRAHIQKVTIEGKGEYHRVRLGPYQHLEELDGASQRLTKLGITAMRLKLKAGDT
jgi:cell division protein FtsN